MGAHRAGRDGGQDTQGAGQGSYQVTSARPAGATSSPLPGLSRQINAKASLPLNIQKAKASHKQESKRDRQQREPHSGLSVTALVLSTMSRDPSTLFRVPGADRRFIEKRVKERRHDRERFVECASDRQQ